MRAAIVQRLSVLGFVFACVILAVIGASTYHRLALLRDASRAVEHTHKVRTELERIPSLLTDAETGQRGFLLTGAVSYLEPYTSALTSLPASLERLGRLTADNPQQQADLAALELLIKQKATELAATVEARKQRGFSAAARLVLTDESKRVMDQIRATIARMDAEERRILTERIQREERAGETLAFTTVGGLTVALILAIVATVLLNRAVRERASAEARRTIAEAAARAAETADRTKDEFLAVLSHELRTPLTSMVGWVKLLQNPRLDSAQRARAIDTIDRSTHVLARMIDDLLDISRIVSGRMLLESAPVNLAPVIAETVDSFQPEAKTKEVTLRMHAEPIVGVVLADRDRIRQVVSNLLANALRHTPAKGRVDVQLVSDKKVIRIRIEDTGSGIDGDDLPHVFERFRQADPKTASMRRGLGLGLAIVKRIVELHGGTVEAYSEGPSRGAAFTVTLPLIVRS